MQTPQQQRYAAEQIKENETSHCTTDFRVFGSDNGVRRRATDCACKTAGG
jgi:hypothetical protein